MLYLSTYINLYLNFSISGFIINLSQSAMHSSPETTQLTQIFKQLDKQKQGYLTLDQFAAYLDHQPRKVPLYLINDFFNTLPQSRMNEQAFICYVMGYRLNLQHLAVARFAMQKQFRKHASASPPSGANQVRKNRIKFHVMSKQKTTVGEKHSLVLKVGHDQREQSQKYEQLEQMLGQKPDEIVGIIKFKVSGAHQQIRQGFETILETAKGILSEMDEDLFKIIDLFKFSVKANGNYIYIIIQVGHVFLTDFVSFINEFIQSISPQALFNFSFGIHSNYFKQFLKQGGEKKMQDLEVNLKLNIDNESLKKLKEIISEKIQIYDDQQKFVSLFIMLIQQISFDASFNNSQKLFNKLGVSQLVEGVKPQLGALKDLMLFENLEGFIPESKQLIENLKKYAKGDGEISINLRSLYVQLEFNVEVEGFFDLF